MIKELPDILPANVSRVIAEFEETHPSYCTCEVSLAYDNALASIFRYVAELRLASNRLKGNQDELLKLTIPEIAERIVSITLEVKKAVAAEHKLAINDFNEFVRLYKKVRKEV